MLLVAVLPVAGPVIFVKCPALTRPAKLVRKSLENPRH
jgi:hypothetical protein